MLQRKQNGLMVSAILSAVVFGGVASAWVPSGGADEVAPGKPKTVTIEDHSPATVEEARARARLLHETFHVTLRVVHRQYYREDEGLLIPSATLKTVFKELEDRWNVKARWLAVNAQAMDIDHSPQDEFEKNAAKALTEGKKEYETVQDGVYRHVGLIVLSSECLKCHLPTRTSTEDRAAGLVIAMPVKQE